MDEKRLQESITRAVDSHCSSLRADPFLAQKVIFAAERKEKPIVKSKMRFGLILALILMLLTATAVAAALLSGMEVIQQEAVPLAQSNDGEVRPVEEYTYEELSSIILAAQENGIILDDDTSVMRALRNGEGYSEEETIMALCREAFGGLIYEWTVEERHFFAEMMIEIGWDTQNNYPLPSENDLPSEEIRALAVETIHKHYGEDVHVEDRSLFRRVEGLYLDSVDGVERNTWTFTFYPRTLDESIYHVTMDGQGQWIDHSKEPGYNWEDYTELQLVQRVDSVYNYRYGGSGMSAWEYDAWYAFGQKLPGAKHSASWDEEFDAYAATVYLLPGENDLTKKQARDIAFADAGVKDYTGVTEILLGKGSQRIWKISFKTSALTGKNQALSYEIDSETREILRVDDLTTEQEWARYMLFQTYEVFAPEKEDVLTQEKAIELAVRKLHAEFNDDTIPYMDESIYEIDAYFNSYTGGYTVIFNVKQLGYGRANVTVNANGTTHLVFANPCGLNGDTLFDCFEAVYGANIYWEQDMWVKFGEEMQQYEPTTFEGKLFKMTTYLPESAVAISRDKAMDIVYLDSGKSDINRIVLIDAEPNPVWKVRASTWYPSTTLYEVDAMTGEILDKEYYFIQMPSFDNEMMMYTLRRDYKPAALAEFGVERIAMELCVKANAEKFYEESADYLMSGAYRITEEGMTVSFMAVDPRQDSYIVTVAEDATSADITVIPGVENEETLSRDQQAELYALFEGSDRFVPLEEPPEPYNSWENGDGPVEGEMTLAEAQAHAFSLLVDAVGQDTVDAFGKFAVGYRFSRFENDGHCIRWTFFFVNPENVNEGYRVTFAIRNNELWGDGQVSDINDHSNG